MSNGPEYTGSTVDPYLYDPGNLGEAFVRNLREGFGNLPLVELSPGAIVPDLPISGPTEIPGAGAGKVDDAYGD